MRPSCRWWTEVHSGDCGGRQRVMGGNEDEDEGQSRDVWEVQGWRCSVSED